MRCDKCLDHLIEHETLKKDSASWAWFIQGDQKAMYTCLWVRSHPLVRADDILLVDNLYTYANWRVSCVGFS